MPAFKQILAIDPFNTSMVASNAEVLLFAVGDTTQTPLTIWNLSRTIQIPNPVNVNKLGFGPTFFHDDLFQVAWVGGGFTGTFESYDGLRDEAVDARTAAQASAIDSEGSRADAEAAAANAAAAVEIALAGAVADAQTARAAAVAASNLVEAPADVAVKTLIQAPGSQTAAALNATIVAKTEPKLDKADAATLYSTPASVELQVAPLISTQVASYIASEPAVVDAAAAAVDANPKIDSIEAAMPWQGIIANGIDINTIRKAGVYTVPTTAVAGTLINWPTSRAGILTVWTNAGSSATTHEVTAYVSTSVATEKYARATLLSANSSWSPWTTLEWVKGIANGTSAARQNIDTFRNVGAWAISSTTYVDGLPTAYSGIIEVFSYPGTGLAMQRYTARVKADDFAVWHRLGLSTSGFAGIAWKTPSPDPATPVAPVGASDPVSDHATRVEYARTRRGGGIGTSGKAVVMLRFDHWLLKFRDVILPIMREFDLPGTLNVNYDNMSNVQNGAGSIPWANVQDWNQYDGIEIANHGATHTDASTRASIYHEVVEGRRSLETAMPRVAVETWHEHGSAYLTASDIPGDIGLNLGREPKNFFESYAGKLIMAEHAVVEGKCGGFFVNLNGEPQIGQSHMSIDQSTAAQAIGQVTTAKTFNRGVTLYLHPGLMDTVLVGGKAWDVDYKVSGSVDVTDPLTSTTTNYATQAAFENWATTNGHTIYMPTSAFRELCAHLAAERAAGNIMVMTAAGGAFANKATTYRENLLVNPDFTGTVADWWGGATTWTITNPGPNVVIKAPATTGTITQGMLLHSRFGWAMGATHELLVKVRSSSAATLTLRIEKLGDPTTWQTEKTYTIPADNTTRNYRLNITLPRDPTITQMSIKITGTNGLEIMGAPVLAAI